MISDPAPSEACTLLDKIWSQHVIVPRPGGEELLFVDLNLVHEGGTFLAFDQLRIEDLRLAAQVVRGRSRISSARPWPQQQR